MPFVYKVNDRVFEGNIKGYHEAQVFANQAAGVIEQFPLVVPHPNAEAIKACADGKMIQLSTMSYSTQVLIAFAIPIILVIGTVALTVAYAWVFNK